jgi:hypothetical protein
MLMCVCRASLEEYKMADVQGDGLSSFEAFALYMMKIQTCNEDETLPEGIKLNCKVWHDFIHRCQLLTMATGALLNYCQVLYAELLLSTICTHSFYTSICSV